MTNVKYGFLFEIDGLLLAAAAIASLQYFTNYKCKRERGRSMKVLGAAAAALNA